jgi:hypothetical protein
VRRIVRPEAVASAASAASTAAAELEAERAAQQQAMLDAWALEREQLQTTIGVISWEREKHRSLTRRQEELHFSKRKIEKQHFCFN